MAILQVALYNHDFNTVSQIQLRGSSTEEEAFTACITSGKNTHTGPQEAPCKEMLSAFTCTF